ncbi:NBPF family member NBPF6-like, partial [Callorhinus ursinus]|uniref:NBPF family member NBPF6-like n=1 Tax=Callorhinus ursinus TaxID=34884 RepID=UPI003CD02E2B
LCHTLIKEQAKELTRLYQKLRKGTDVSQLLNKHLEDLLTHDDPEHSQGQGFQEQLAEGRRLAKCLARKLSPENYEDEEDEEEQETLTPSMEQQQVEKKEVLQDTVDECVLTPSTLQEECDNDQSYSAGEFPLDEQEFSSALDLACECSHTQGDETSRGPPESQDDRREGNGQQPMCPSMEPQDVEKKEFLQDTVDECVLTPSTVQERRDSGQSYRDGKFLFDEQEFGSTVDMANECSHSKGAITPRGPPEDRTDQEGLGGQEPAAPRLSRQLVEVVQQDVSTDSQDEHYLTYSVLPDLSDSYWPYRRAAIFLPEELEVCSSLKVT